MNYQLVLKFRSDSFDDFDAVVALEDELIEALSDQAKVDGHDVGSGETNIFILTSDPEVTFSLAKPVLGRAKYLPTVTAAYREADGNRYTVIWPKGSHERFTVT